MALQPATRKLVAQWVSVVCAIVFAVGLMLNSSEEVTSLSNPNYGNTTFGSVMAMAAAVIFIVFWAYAVADVVHRDLIKPALTPVPDAFQIAAQLRIEMGREPTLVEVAAVHQMLTSDHNQKLIGAAALLGSALLIDKNLHGK
jgi:hypothetical protein